MRGTVFDIKEFALHDGGGIRTTVFLKGCPLRCIWCHNPEGLSPRPELYERGTPCLSCGLCRRDCGHEDCRTVGRCLHICPVNRLRLAGVEWESDALVERLLGRSDLYESTGGGVTLSGGEPLLQYEFAAAVLQGLEGRVHRAVETSGYGLNEAFRAVATRCELVYMDLKLADPQAHRRYTGVDNGIILKNAEWLKGSGIPHVFRIPLIPGITDGEENLRALSAVIGDSPAELLPYNPLAPAKYAGVGRRFTDEITSDRSATPDLSIFRNASLRK